MRSNFPHLLDKPFSIEIVPSSNGDALTSDPSDTMVLRIIDKKLSQKQKHHFYYGSQNSINGEFKGKYMDIEIWKKDLNAKKITLSIMFKTMSHEMFIELFVFSSSNELQHLKILKDLNLAKNLLRQQIDIFYPTKLNLFIKSLNNNINNTNGILPGDRVVASCRAYVGFPNHKPIFTIPDQLNVSETVYDERIFELKIYFFVSINNHLENLTCKAGNTSESINVYILHHPTSIFIEPQIDKLLEPNTTLKCLVKDGYPAPEIAWQFISGPENASMHYNITSNGSQLYFKSNSLIKSSWKFKCSAKGFSKITERIISFSIAVHPSHLYIEPQIKKWLLSNSTISCYIKEKYLNLEIKWQLIKGPPNDSLYYNVLKNGSELFMNSNNSPGILWTFRCIIKSILTKTTKALNKTISFITANHPTSIFIEPRIDKLLEPNTTITCFVKDGYPAPEIAWQFISGPVNASMYYNITSNGSQLYIKSNSPIKSSWTFKCSIKGFSKITEKYISFSTAVHPSQLYFEPDIKKWLQSNSSISCFIRDEYLNPEIKLQLIKGPPNASLYYNVLNNGTEIFMNSNNSPGTMWTFICNVKTILTTTKTINKTISFVVSKSKKTNCNERCINSRLTEVEESIEEIIKVQHDIKASIVEKERNINSQIQSSINYWRGDLQKKIDMINGQLKNINENIGSITEILPYDLKKSLFRFRSYFYGRYSSETGSWHDWKNGIELQIKVYFSYDIEVYIKIYNSKLFGNNVYLTFQCIVTADENWIFADKYKIISREALHSYSSESFRIGSFSSSEVFSSTSNQKCSVECFSFNRN